MNEIIEAENLHLALDSSLDWIAEPWLKLVLSVIVLKQTNVLELLIDITVVCNQCKWFCKAV